MANVSEGTCELWIILRLLPMSLAATKTKYQHVVLDEQRVPIIAGTNMKVIELVLEKTAYGWSPEKLCFQHPYLTLGQVYSALAYYSDHQDELDRDVERRLRNVEETRRESGTSLLVNRLRAKGLI